MFKVDQNVWINSYDGRRELCVIKSSPDVNGHYHLISLKSGNIIWAKPSLITPYFNHNDVLKDMLCHTASK